MTGDAVGYRLTLTPTEAQRIREMIGGKKVAVVRSTRDLEIQKKDYWWGTLEYAFTPFDIIYRGLTSDGKEVAKGKLEFPIEGERSSDATVEIVAGRVADLVQRVNESS